jgi:uncharacterized Zn finger protein
MMDNKMKMPGLDIKQTTAIKCESCENETFSEVVYLRKASKLLTGSSQDSIVPIPTFQCSKCGHINKEFTPKIDIA